jgi:hypothetical protein
LDRPRATVEFERLRMSQLLIGRKVVADRAGAGRQRLRRLGRIGCWAQPGGTVSLGLFLILS